MASIKVDATFDGNVFRPTAPVALPPNTNVHLTVDAAVEHGESPAKLGEPYSFFETALSLKLNGPSDWSRNFHKYLYGEGCRSDEG